MARIRRPLGIVDPNAGAAVQNPPQADPKSAATEPASTATSKKRKSSEAAPSASATAPATKKTKAASANDAVKKLAKQLVKNAASDFLDVSDIVYLGDEDVPVPIYDTCDTVRRKIRAMLAKDGVTQAAFLRAIVTAAYGEGSTKKIQSASLNAFLKQKGPLAGNTSAVYYAAYVFFEKRRVKEGKPKSKDREIMEDINFDGVDTKVQSGKVGYVVMAGSKVGMDKYGRVFTY